MSTALRGTVHDQEGDVSDYLGEFEQMVLLAILRLGPEAYGLAVRDELESVAGRKPSSGALYTTLDRLERKKLIEASWGSGSAERGGRARRYVRPTPMGLDALRASRERLIALWEGCEVALDRP